MASVRRAKKPDASKAPAELQKTLEGLKSRMGEKTVLRGNEINQPWRIPTGIFALDLALLGGIPHNRTTMFEGAKHGGKTTGALKTIRGAQNSMEGSACMVDVEGTYDAVWAEKNGVDTEALIVVQPDTGEQAIDATVALVEARETSLIVVDSIAMLVPYKEIEGSAEDANVGLQSRMLTRFLRVVGSALITERKRDHFVTLLLINQQRSKIGGFAPAGIEPLSNPGGKALGHATSVEVTWKNKEVLKSVNGEQTTVHNDHAFTIKKNKLNGGIRQGEFRMMRMANEELGLAECDIDDAGTMLLHAKRLEWLTGGGRAGQDLTIPGYDPIHFDNAEAAVQYLYQYPEMYAALRCHLIANHAESLGMPEYFVNYLRGEEE